MKRNLNDLWNSFVTVVKMLVYRYDDW